MYSNTCILYASVFCGGLFEYSKPVACWSAVELLVLLQHYNYKNLVDTENAMVYSCDGDRVEEEEEEEEGN